MTHDAHFDVEDVSAETRECAAVLARRSTMADLEEPSPPPGPPVEVVVPAKLAALDVVYYVILWGFIGTVLLGALLFAAIALGSLGADDY